MIDDKLKTLIVLAEVKSYTKTAEQCHLSQPAVTQHIKALENFYNVELFHRVGRELFLTSEGEIILKNAKKLYALNEKLNKELTEQTTGYQKLDIGITLTAGNYFIPEILNVFKVKFPSLRYNFHTDINPNILRRLENQELDFAIIDGNPQSNIFLSNILTKDELIIIGPKDHPLAQLTNVTINDLKKEKFILRHETANTRMAFEHFLNLHDESIKNFEVVLEIDNTALIKQLIIAGHGLSVMSRAICDINLKVGTLSEIKVEGLKLERGIYLVYPKKLSDNPIITEIKRLGA